MNLDNLNENFLADQGVVYFSHGTKHLTRLVVSLCSLRKQYHGPVAVLCTDRADGIVDAITKAFDAYLIQIGITQYPKNSAYIAKASLWRKSPFERCLLIDSDTVIARPLDRLLELVRFSSGIVVPQFSNWVTSGQIIASRLEKWRQISWESRGITYFGSSLYEDCVAHGYPAINTGVVGWGRMAYGSGVLEAWESATISGRKTPFTDELACQLVIRSFPHTLVDDRYNCSPIYGVNRDKAVIWHAHGHKELRPEASGIWLPLIRECLGSNVAGYRDWYRQHDAGLAAYLEANPAC